jgi:hypothetical protein
MTHHIALISTFVVGVDKGPYPATKRRSFFYLFKMINFILLLLAANVVVYFVTW